MNFSVSASRLGQYAVIACLASATLGFELVQTRILSALYYNHVVYLTVTIALMGFGISGVLVSLLSQKNIDQPRVIAVACALFAITMVLCMYAASHLPQWYPNGSLVSKLMQSYLLLVIPFLCSGTAIGLILMRSGADVFRVYCFDLMASALACVAFTFLLTPLGASGFIWACVFLACVAFVVQATASSIATAKYVAFLFIIGFLFTYYGHDVVGNRPEPYKTLGLALAQGAKVEVSKWTPITRLDIINRPGHSHKMILQDADAHTKIFSPNNVNWELRNAAAGRASSGALTFPYLIRQSRPEESLVIGVGGGIDVLRSHAYGAKHTTGVEINPVTVRLVTKRYAGFAVWPQWPDIDIVVEEGRHFIRSHKNRYQTITMSGIDTFSALNSGAYVLSENYLYTTEAFEDYLNALTDDGIMAINRWFEAIPPRESLRLASLHVEASRRLGIAHPEQNIFVVVDGDWAATLIKKTPFTREEILKSFEHIKNSRLRVVYLPKIFDADEQKSIERHIAAGRNSGLNIASRAYEKLVNPVDDEAREAFYKEYPLDVTPVYDDRPFFFEYHKGFSLKHWKHGMSRVRANVNNNLYLLLLVGSAVSLVAMIGPLLVFSSQGLKTSGFHWLFIYFSSVGVGFMAVEIGMMQRLSLYLGDPMHSLLVVLASLLLCAGIGSFFSQKITTSEKRFAYGTLGVMCAVLLWLLIMPSVISFTQAYPYIMRVLIAVLSLIPVGMLMGIPFASGLDFVSHTSARFVPWAWGINGLTSVVASILAIIVAMNFGFTVVLVIGSIVYLLGFIAMHFYRINIQKN